MSDVRRQAEELGVKTQGMKKIDVAASFGLAKEGVATDVMLEQGAVKVRRIELAAGARIPPCQMQEDVVFIVLAGRVMFRTETEEMRVEAPGAVFIPGGATTRSMEAHEASVVLAVLCRRETGIQEGKKETS